MKKFTSWKDHERTTSWTSHKHPEDSNFMQVVKFMHVQYSDGRNNLYWSLFNSSANDKHLISNISLVEAQSRFVDDEVKELTEADFQNWLANK